MSEDSCYKCKAPICEHVAGALTNGITADRALFAERTRVVDLESRLAEAERVLRRSDELLSWITFDDGMPNVWPEEAVISACRANNRAFLDREVKHV